MDKVQKYASTNANAPSSETYRSNFSKVQTAILSELLLFLCEYKEGIIPTLNPRQREACRVQYWYPVSYALNLPHPTVYP
jgi:hypothetical protein